MNEMGKHKSLIGLLAFATAATMLLIIVQAATTRPSFEAESASNAQNAAVEADSTASGGEYLAFGRRGGSTGSNTTPQNYQASLALIQASTFRNTTMDNSPYINTPSAQLYDKADLYTTESTYASGSGSYGQVPYFQRELFGSAEAAAFRSECEVSHFSYDDPIVYPGQPERSHLHMFVGNTHTNAYSTYDSILNSGSSTCNGNELNRTAYWVPAMFDGKGNVVAPSKVRFYYKTEKSPGIGKVNTYPDNLQLVGDNTNNNASSKDKSTFLCNDIYNGGKRLAPASAYGNTIPSCVSPNPVKGDPGVLEYRIFFDYCWTGRGDIGDWEANQNENFRVTINPNNPSREDFFSSVCPSSHPVMLPALVTHIFYDIKPGENTRDWFLASDVNAQSRTLQNQAGASAHADWFGGWNKQVNAEWVENCSNKQGAKCGTGLLETHTTSKDARALVRRKDWIAGPTRIPVSVIYQEMCSKSDTAPLSQANGAMAGAWCQ